jgi:hypothetical protein
MRFPVLSVAIMLIIGGCATAPQASVQDRTMPFGCNDSVVVGTVENGTFQPVESEADILGHGWISATLHVRKVVRGTSLRSVLPVRYFSHAYMRHDREFMLVLKHTGTGFEITDGQLMSERPRLASHCS